MRVAKEGLRVTEVPSFEHSRIHGVSNLSAVSDGLRVLTTIVVERRRGGRTRRARHSPLDTRAVAVPASGLIQIETAFLRMLYVLYSIEHGRPCIHLGRPPAIRPRIASPTAIPSGQPHHRVLAPGNYP